MNDERADFPFLDFGQKERILLLRLVKISEKGNHAEVKKNRDGTWTVYEVKKKKEVVWGGIR